MIAPARLAQVAFVAVVVAVAIAAAAPGNAEPGHIVLASTTSTENSGLLADILPLFQRRTGIEVRVVAVGTGQAIRLAQRGDADVLLLHHRPSEDAFVAQGYGIARYNVMYNDFVLVGPHADPAGVRSAKDVALAFAAIAGSGVIFASRGDDSGTHKKEIALWQAATVDPGEVGGLWYRETGSGMGATLNVAATLDAYTISDRATWLRFANKQHLEILVEGDPRLFNQYGVIVLDPARHPHVRVRQAQAFVGWLTSRAGQTAIAAFRIGGEQAFFPNAKIND